LARVLLVDDDAAVLETTAALLEDVFDVVKASSGTQALGLLTAQAFDVICTDLQMPAMNGIELLRRAASIRPQVSAVLITGHREYLTEPRSRDLAYTVLLKPFSEREVIEQIRRAENRTKLASQMRIGAKR
jgi:DNA-binding NtrC family response regulator